MTEDMTEDMAVDMTVNTTEDPQPYIEFDKLKVAQLRRILIDEFDFSESEVKNIKGKANLLKEIKEYCEWASVSIDSFFEQSAEFILKKDTEWKKFKKNKS